MGLRAEGAEMRDSGLREDFALPLHSWGIVMVTIMRLFAIMVFLSAVLPMIAAAFISTAPVILNARLKSSPFEARAAVLATVSLTSTSKEATARYE